MVVDGMSNKYKRPKKCVRRERKQIAKNGAKFARDLDVLSKCMQRVSYNDPPPEEEPFVYPVGLLAFRADKDAPKGRDFVKVYDRG